MKSEDLVADIGTLECDLVDAQDKIEVLEALLIQTEQEVHYYQEEFSQATEDAQEKGYYLGSEYGYEQGWNEGYQAGYEQGWSEHVSYRD